MEYDYIVIDFHSAEQTADLEASMNLINTAIIVAEAGRTSSESLCATLRLFPKKKVAALVLNKILV
jgi:Mrp family chromosome partitioning ATPase